MDNINVLSDPLCDIVLCPPVQHFFREHCAFSNRQPSGYWSHVSSITEPEVLGNLSPSSTPYLTNDWQVWKCGIPAPVATALSCTYLHSRDPLQDQAEGLPGLHFNLTFPPLSRFPGSLTVSHESTSLISPLHRNPGLRTCCWDTVFQGRWREEVTVHILQQIAPASSLDISTLLLC